MGDATALVERVLGRYRGARTYEDEGTVVVRDGTGGVIHLLSFRTRFVRGGSLDLWTRQDDGDEISLAWDGTRATILPVALGRIGDGPSLAAAIATLTGVTMGVAANVPGLLDAALGGRGVFDGALRAGEPIEVDGVTCEVVHVRGDTRVLVEPTTATVRRIDDVRSVTTLRPTLPE